MKKQRFFALFCLIAALFSFCLLSACGKSGDETPSLPDPDASTPETPETPETPDAPAGESGAAEIASLVVTPYVRTFSFYSSDSTVLLEGSFSVPAIPAFPQLSRYYENLALEHQEECSALVSEAQEARSLTSGDWTAWQCTLSYDVLRNDGRLLSIFRTFTQDAGGVHPSTYCLAETFDAQTGGRLLLGDLFSAEERVYLPRLLDAVRAQMSAGDADYYDDAAATLEQVFDPVNFAVEDDALLLFFNTSEIAPYAAGLQQFRIPLADLSDLLSDHVR